MLDHYWVDPSHIHTSEANPLFFQSCLLSTVTMCIALFYQSGNGASFRSWWSRRFGIMSIEALLWQGEMLLLHGFGQNQDAELQASEMSDRHEQEAGLKCGYDSVRSKWTFSLGSLYVLCHEFKRRREETAWKRRRVEISLVIVISISCVLTYVYNLFWNGVCVLYSCNLYLTRFQWLDKRFVIDNFLIAVSYKMLFVMTEDLNSKYVH